MLLHVNNIFLLNQLHDFKKYLSVYPRATPYPQQPPSTYGTGGGNSLRDMGIGFAGGALLGGKMLEDLLLRHIYLIMLLSGALGYAWGDGWGYGMGPAEPNDGYW